jgi:hypothetical protein
MVKLIIDHALNNWRIILECSVERPICLNSVLNVTGRLLNIINQTYQSRYTHELTLIGYINHLLEMYTPLHKMLIIYMNDRHHIIHNQ